MSIQEDILEGLMLSDLSIPSPRRKTQNTFMTLTTIHKEFADHLVEVLDSEGFKIYERKARVSYDKKLNKIFNHKTSYYVQTLTKERYKDLRQVWYVDKKKIVPKTIKLNPISLKYMFYGDGCCSKYGKYGWQINLATNSFTLEECNFIKDLLLNKYNLHFTVSRTSKAKEQYQLRLQIQKDVKLFFEIIEESIPCFEYKWKLKDYVKPLPKENPNWRKIVHKETGIIFNTIVEGAKFANMKSVTLCGQLKQNRDYCLFKYAEG